MADITYTFTCPDCGETLEAEIIVHSAGYPATGLSGPPENYDPGDGPEYSLETDVKCTGTIAAESDEGEDLSSSCGRIFDDDYFQSGKPEDEIIQQIGEREYDYTGPDTREEDDD